MIKSAIEKILDIAKPETFEISGETYSSEKLYHVEPVEYRPDNIGVSGLDSIVKLIRTEISSDRFEKPLFIRVNDHLSANVFTTFGGLSKRDYLYSVRCDTPQFIEGFRDQQKAHIELRSRFVPTDDVDYILDLISRMTVDNSVTTKDNGVTQDVEVRSGIQLKLLAAVRPRVSLKPFRTFLEVDQPASDFLLRVDDDGNIGLFEADGGTWKLTAKKNIAAYFEDSLETYIADRTVVVMM